MKLDYLIYPSDSSILQESVLHNLIHEDKTSVEEALLFTALGDEAAVAYSASQDRCMIRLSISNTVQ